MRIEIAEAFCDECIKQIPILENEKFGNLLLSSIKLNILNSQNVGYDIALKINDSKKKIRIVNEREILFVYSKPIIFGDDYRSHQIDCFLETKRLIVEFLNQQENQFNFLTLSDFNAYLNTIKSKYEIETLVSDKTF